MPFFIFTQIYSTKMPYNMGRVLLFVIILAVFNSEQLSQIFNPQNYLGNTQQQIDAVLQRVQGK